MTSNNTAGAAQPRSRWRSTIALIVALLVALFSIAGYFTAASLQASGYQTAAKIYVGLLALSSVVIIGILIVRRRGGD